MDQPCLEYDGSASEHAQFEREVGQILESLRAALAGLIEAITPPVRRASEFQRSMRLDKNLGWSVFTAATTQNLAQVAALIPGQHAMNRVFKAAKNCGVPAHFIEHARAKFASFEDAIRRHAHDREAFEAMVADVAAGGLDTSAAMDARHRRVAFRANTLLWGQMARVIATAVIVHPSSRAGLFDSVSISGMVDLRQTRRGFPLQTLVTRRHRPDPGDPSPLPDVEALDPRERHPNAVGLMRDFCSQPTPDASVVLNEDGAVCHHLRARGLGATAAMTFYTGHLVRRSMVRPGSVPGSRLMLEKPILTPAELLIRDVLMHHSVWDDRPPEVKVYASPPDSPHTFRDIDLLPFAESASYLGRGVAVARTPEIPRYGELLNYAIDQLGGNPEEYRVFRCRVPYPVMYSRVCLLFE
jgi:hypothetical protein